MVYLSNPNTESRGLMRRILISGYGQILCMNFDSGGVFLQAVDELDAGDDLGDER